MEGTRWVKVKFHGDKTKVGDISQVIRDQLHAKLYQGKLEQGDEVCVAVGSRGIANLDRIVKEVITWLKKEGFKPFIVPAMGSHGGAVAEGQRNVLAEYGITEENMCCPIKSSMEVVQIGETERGNPVYVDKFCSRAQGVIVINRVKPHTLFSGPVESGLMKMLAIGLGKHKGALTVHKGIIKRGTDSTILLETSRVIRDTLNLLFGLAILENSYDETAHLEVVQPKDMEGRESELLQQARRMMPRIPFKYLDLLIIDEIGKDISGSGADPNVVGRKFGSHSVSEPEVLRLFIRDLTEKTGGNAIGIGRADFTTTRLANKIDQKSTYANAITSMFPVAAKVPIYFDSDREVLENALLTMGDVTPQDVKGVWINNTLQLGEFLITDSLFAEADQEITLEITGEEMALRFNSEGNLVRASFEFESPR